MPRSSRPPGKKAPPSGSAGPRARSSKPAPDDDVPKRPSVEVRVKPGERPGSEVHEIVYDSEPPPRAAKTPVPKSPRDPYPDHETTKQGLGLGDQVRVTMPTRPPPKSRGLKRIDTQDLEKPTNPPPDGSRAGQIETPMPQAWAERETPAHGLRGTHSGLGVPSPSLGSDTDFDPSAMTTVAPQTRRTSPSQDIDLGLELGVKDSDVPDSNDALDLVSRNPGSSIVPPEPAAKSDPLSELRERYALGDFSGALAIAEGILTGDPENVDAQRYAESCRDVLRQMYAARLGPLDQVPVVAIPTEQLRWLTLDHRSGFLLSHVDGVSTLEEILDVSGMNPLEAMRIIYDLLQQKVIALQ